LGVVFEVFLAHFSTTTCPISTIDTDSESPH
jgi:hypothetical protein